MNRATEVWLLRHAESADPTVFHGAESDIGLSQLGERQAATIGEWFTPLRPTVVVSSAMLRAVRTAAPIAEKCRVPHHTIPAFHERRVGILGGTSFNLKDGFWVETLQHWTRGNTAFTTPGAESYDELRTRLLGAWTELLARFEGERIALVTHGVVCKVLLLSLLPEWGPSRWHELGMVRNVAVSELSVTATGCSAGRLLHVPDVVEQLAQATEVRAISHG